MSTGMIFGPALGSLLVRLTGSSLAVFYVTVIVHFCYILLVRLVVPESLLDSEMTQSKNKYNELKQAARVDRRTFFDLAQRFLVFLRPLLILFPRVEGELVKMERINWSLTWIALAYGLMSTVMVGPLSHPTETLRVTNG
jgi:MFS family permease